MACLRGEGIGTNAQWVEFVDHEVVVEEARKASIEARGVATVTAASAIATVLLALVTVTKKSGQSVLVVPGGARPWVEIALACFLGAAALGVLTNYPVTLYWVTPSKLSDYIDEQWEALPGVTQQKIIDHQIKRLTALHKWNTVKGYVLMVAMAAQVLAIVSIVIAVFTAF